MPAQTCPEPVQLQALVLGHLDDAQAECLEEHEEHVEQCAWCGGRLGTLPAEDTLVSAMRAHARVALPSADLTALQDLLPRLRQLRPTNSAATPYPQGASAMNVNVDTLEILGPPQSADELGRLGPYRVLKRLGQGGMGMVFLAEYPSLQRTVALKVMLPELAKKAVARERFLREARATAKIEHDHIVTIFQVGEDRGVPYLAMQLLKGCSLEDNLRTKQGAAVAPLTVDQVLKLGREIAKGLAAAHARGLIHRDIKPANIWLDATAGGRVKILDFGLARPAEEDAQLTQSGVIVGTATYMAPEQARGERLDARAALFSLGCVLYRLCTGRLPWKGCDVMATLIAVATEPPTPILDLNPDLPAPFARLVMQLLAKRPEDRPASAKAVADAILALERAQPTVQIKMALPLAALTPPAPPRHDVAETTGMLLTQTVAPDTRRRRRQRAGAVAAAFLLGGLALAVVFYVQSDTGTLKIESDDPDVQVIVEQNGKQVEVLDKKKGTKVVLHSGEYRLRLGDASKDIKLDKDKIQITRDGVVVVTISKARQPRVPSNTSATHWAWIWRRSRSGSL